MKLIQTVMLCHELKRMCDEANQSFRPGGRTSAPPGECHKMALVLCGDFNSLPDSGELKFTKNQEKCTLINIINGSLSCFYIVVGAYNGYVGAI